MSESNTNKPAVTHSYNPWGPTWDNPEVEAVVDEHTVWHQICDKKITLTNAEYVEFLKAWSEDMPDTCQACIEKMREEDPYGIIYDLDLS